MISSTALAVAVWGSVGLLAVVFAHLIRSLLAGPERSGVADRGVDR